MPNPSPGRTPLLTSADVARRLGVSVSAVKRWADDGTLASERTAGGHRRFRSGEVERMRREACRREGPDAWDGWVRGLESGDVHAAFALLYGERSRLGSWFPVAERLGELLADIGARWFRGDLSVAREHVATSTLGRALLLVAEAMPVPPQAPRCLLACVEGDDHTLGLSLAEVCLREAGWRTEWIGRDTRRADVCERVGAHAVQMVGLSASVHSSDPRRLRAQARAIAQACRGAGIPLVLGGSGAWPESIPHGVRIRRWEDFQAFLQATPHPA